MADPPARYAAASCLFLVVVVGMSLSTIYQEHYSEPITGVGVLLMLESLRRLAVGLWRWVRLRPLWQPMIAVLPPLIAGYALHFTFATKPAQMRDISVERPRIIDKLNRFPGKQHVIVRYRSTHNPLLEWVYNAANIDESKIAWARELDPASNANLLQYFHGRRPWLLDPDALPPRLQPYQPGQRLPAL